MKRFPDAWIQTFSGKKFFPLEPDPQDIDIVDIAHALSMMCRFAGHCEVFYSVGQHSILAAKEAERLGLSRVIILQTLLHDASEAYICDIPKPLKKVMHDYKEMEMLLENCIFSAFGLPLEMPYIIKKIDNAMLVTEYHQLMKNTESWRLIENPLDIIITPMSPQETKVEFLEMFERLI